MGRLVQYQDHAAMPGRRNCLALFAAGWALGPTLVLAANTDSMAGPVEVQLAVPAAKLEDARGTLGFRDDQVKPDLRSVNDKRGPALIYILVGAASLIEISRALVEIYRDLKSQDEGATVIDATGKKLLITHDLKGPPGKILVRQPGGKVEVIDGRKGYDSGKWLDLLQVAVKGAGGAAK